MTFTDRVRQLFERNTKTVETSSKSFLETFKHNPNDMGNYLPAIEGAAKEAGFLIPETRILTIPDELLVSIFNSDIRPSEKTNSTISF